jgi:DNA primase
MDPVLDLLNKYEVPFRVSGRDYVTKCLNPEHDDKNPSFRIDKLTGVAHCFSCGFKVNIFRHFGILTTSNSIRVAKLKQKLKDLNVNLNGVEFPHDMIPYNKSFRGISAQTMREFNAFYTNVGDLVDRVFFPISDIRNRIVVYVGRHTMSSGNPRYLNVPGGAIMPVFPEKLKTKTRSLVLVEGIFDLLNVYDKGLKNVVCTFGTANLLKDTAIKLLPFKTQGITKIYLMFDGDEAGRNAMDKLQPLIEEADFEVDRINLEDDTDPGDLDKESVQSIIEWIATETITNDA